MLNQNIQECFQTDSYITNITVLSDGFIAISTLLHGITIFSSTDYTLQRHLSINLLGDTTTATAFSQEHKLFAFANAQTIHIINLQNRTTLQTIQTDEGEIEKLIFMKESPYLIIGTKKGHVSQYRYDGNSQLSCLCSFPVSSSKKSIKVKNSYVSAIASNAHYIASSGYGGAITIVQIYSLTKVTRQTSRVRINALLFIDNQTLVSANIDGIVQIHSLQKEQPCKNITTPFTNIQNITLMPNKKYIIVSGPYKKLILIDLELAKIVSNNYLVFQHKIKQILLTPKAELFVALESNELLKIQVANEKELYSYRLHNSLDKAFELVKYDPMLLGTQEHTRVEAIYESCYVQATQALINTDIKEALKVIEMFQDVACKKKAINSLFEAYKHYPRFKTLYLEKKYALLYAMCEKFPELKYTQEFQKLEESFQHNFTSAQKQILLANEERAKELLSPYMTVLSKKPIIQLLLKNNADFLHFLKALQKREYLLIEKLVKKNEIFAKIPTYRAFQHSLSESLHDIEESINANQIEQAIEQIKLLQNIPTIQKELKELFNRCKMAQELYKSYDENDFKHCYEILDTNKNLEELELAKLLERHWAKCMQKCEEFALKGTIKSIKKELKELIGVETRATKIGDLLRISFHTKIKILLSKKKFNNAENIIYSYVDIFGIDSQIGALIQNYEQLGSKKLAITHNQETTLSRDAWRNSTLLMDN